MVSARFQLLTISISPTAMYIKSGHRFLSEKGQLVFPGPPTRSAFSFSYINPPTTTASTTTVALPDPPEIDDDTNIIGQSLFLLLYSLKSSSKSNVYAYRHVAK